MARRPGCGRDLACRGYGGKFMSGKLFESLEDRRHLSASLLNGALTFNGTAGADVISINLSGTTLATKENGVARNFPAASVTKIVVNGGGGNDQVFIGSTVNKPTFLNGQDG